MEQNVFMIYQLINAEIFNVLIMLISKIIIYAKNMEVIVQLMEMDVKL